MSGKEENQGYMNQFDGVANTNCVIKLDISREGKKNSCRNF